MCFVIDPFSYDWVRIQFYIVVLVQSFFLFVSSFGKACRFCQPQITTFTTDFKLFYITCSFGCILKLMRTALIRDSHLSASCVLYLGKSNKQKATLFKCVLCYFSIAINSSIIFDIFCITLFLKLNICKWVK